MLATTVALAVLTKPSAVRVFILAGQSNMVGHGFIAADPKRNNGLGSLEATCKSPSSSKVFRGLLRRDGTWKSREDVLIHYFGRKGKLTVGYGAGTDCIGPEYGFGNAVGDAIRDPVLLIKLAWGGKSLAQDFRPPSSGGTVGPFYKEVVDQARKVLANMADEFPELKDRPVEISGFGWHQGWNDRINGAFVDEYEANMANFIRDIRKDLGVPDMPFVIAETGMGGLEEKNPRALKLMAAQQAVASHQDFLGNVAFVGTRSFWRPKEISPSAQDYHWNSSGETYYLIGDSMGRAMVSLLKKGKK